MYALYAKVRTVFVVNWPRDKTAEDVTRALARMGGECPYKWDVKTDRLCGAISVTLDTGLDEPVVAQWGKSIEITESGHWTNYNDAPRGSDIAYAPQGKCMATVYDSEDLDDLRELADHGHRVIIRPDHVIVDREPYSGYILEDDCGSISELPYGDPHDYAIAMDWRCELLPVGE